MRYLLCIFSLAQSLWAKPLVLYLTWYDDPTTTIAIHWHTPVDVEENTLLFGDQNRSFTSKSVQVGRRLVHTLFLDSLQPDTEYTFQIPPDTALHRFRTAPQNLNKPLRFVIGGDAYHSKKLFKAMNQEIVKQDPLFTVIGGDIAYAVSSNPFRLSSTSMNRWFAFLQDWQEQMRTANGRIIPFVLVIGNHDINPGTEDLFFQLFSFPEHKLYRTLDFSSYLSLILLDTAHLDPIEGEQTKWLQTTLSQKKKTLYRFPIYHVGAYPSYYAYSGSIPQKIRSNWCPLFDAYGIRYAFEHHSHTWKKTYPIRNNQIDPSGVIYLGDGCWGASPRLPDSRWYLEKAEQKNNVYMIELSPQKGTIKAIDIQGEVFDSLEIIPFIENKFYSDLKQY